MSAPGRRARIGPGHLVLVVGPSGAGKDTLIRAARQQLADDPTFVFPRRVITRDASDAEDNIAVDQAIFAKIAATGGFAVSWAAHGLSYAILAEIDFALVEGRTVVCNVSRAVLPDLRTRYENVVVVEVTAPASVLAQRLQARGRVQDGDPSLRLARSLAAETIRADVTIMNAGQVEGAWAAFIELLLQNRAGPIDPSRP